MKTQDKIITDLIEQVATNNKKIEELTQIVENSATKNQLIVIFIASCLFTLFSSIVILI